MGYSGKYGNKEENHRNERKPQAGGNGHQSGGGLQNLLHSPREDIELDFPNSFKYT